MIKHFRSGDIGPTLVHIESLARARYRRILSPIPQLHGFEVATVVSKWSGEVLVYLVREDFFSEPPSLSLDPTTNKHVES